jgi:hypothetical protein
MNDRPREWVWRVDPEYVVGCSGVDCRSVLSSKDLPPVRSGAPMNVVGAWTAYMGMGVVMACVWWPAESVDYRSDAVVPVGRGSDWIRNDASVGVRGLCLLSNAESLERTRWSWLRTCGTKAPWTQWFVRLSGMTGC